MKVCNRLKKSRGISLVEVLVAFVILALSITVLLRIFSTGLTNAILSQQYVEAVVVAETQLSQAGLTDELPPSVLSGKSGGMFYWQTKVEPYSPWSDTDQTTMPVYAYLVNVEVSWRERGKDRHISLTALKLLQNKKLNRRG